MRWSWPGLPELGGAHGRDPAGRGRATRSRPGSGPSSQRPRSARSTISGVSSVIAGLRDNGGPRARGHRRDRRRQRTRSGTWSRPRITTIETPVRGTTAEQVCRTPSLESRAEHRLGERARCSLLKVIVRASASGKLALRALDNRSGRGRRVTYTHQVIPDRRLPSITASRSRPATDEGLDGSTSRRHGVSPR